MKTMETDDQLVTRLWAVRHGEPHAAIRGRCYGRLDAGLSDTGRTQLEQVARALATRGIAAIYASPRARTRESAGIIARHHQCPVRIREQLCEVDFGDFAGLAYDGTARRYPAEYQLWMEPSTDVQFPNGECFHTTQRRVQRVANEIAHKRTGETIAIVTHGGVNRILLEEALGTPDANLFRTGQGHGACNPIQHTGGYPPVELMNHVPAPH